MFEYALKSFVYLMHLELIFEENFTMVSFMLLSRKMMTARVLELCTGKVFLLVVVYC